MELSERTKHTIGAALLFLLAASGMYLASY